MIRSFQAGICLAVCLFLAPYAPAQKSFGSLGQGAPNPAEANAPPSVFSHGSVLMLTITAEKNQPLDRQAIVMVTNTTDNSSQAQPTQEVRGKTGTTFVNLTAGVYDVSVTALGYLASHKQFTATGAITTSEMQFVLRRDPSAVDLEAIKTREMPSQERKDLLRGWAALKSGKMDDAEKKLEAANKLDPSNGDVAFLLGYVYFERNEAEKAHEHLTRAIRLSPHNVQALTLYGRVEILRGDFAAARGPLQQAVVINPDNWMAHYLLSNVYLKQKEYAKAQSESEAALEKGRDAANAAELTLGQALANQAQYPAAIAALQTFLVKAPADPAVSQVHDLIAEIEHLRAANATQTASSMSISEPLLAKTKPELPANSWGPPGIDDVKPVVAAGVSCPQGKVLWNVGEHVKGLVDDLAKFDAIEEVNHQELDQAGLPKREVTLKFDYTAEISEPMQGRFIVDEFRIGRSGTEQFPDQIATKGLPTLAFVFHPDMRDNFDMQCEGLGTWSGKSAWLVRFEQREDKPHRIEDYFVNNKFYPVSLKGRAWIDADTYEIVRMESDLAKPIPEIQLLSQHQIVEYAPVNFAKSKTELWLPKTAELTFDFRRHHYYRRHSFDHFMLFAVQTEEKRKEPQAKADGPGSRFHQHWFHHHKSQA